MFGKMNHVDLEAIENEMSSEMKIVVPHTQNKVLSRGEILIATKGRLAEERSKRRERCIQDLKTN